MAQQTSRAARVVGALLLLVMVASLVWVFGYVDRADLPDQIPSYALASPVIMRLEWALAATVAAAIPLLIVGRLLTGRFPTRISTQGAEWSDAADDVVQTLAANDAAIDSMLDILDDYGNFILDHENRLQQGGH